MNKGAESKRGDERLRTPGAGADLKQNSRQNSRRFGESEEATEQIS